MLISYLLDLLRIPRLCRGDRADKSTQSFDFAPFGSEPSLDTEPHFVPGALSARRDEDRTVSLSNCELGNYVHSEAKDRVELKLRPYIFLRF